MTRRGFLTWLYPQIIQVIRQFSGTRGVNWGNIEGKMTHLPSLRLSLYLHWVGATLILVLKPIETYWNLLKPIETYWNLLKPIETYWNLLKPIETYWNLLKPIETYWNLLKPIETYWNLLKPIETYGDLEILHDFRTPRDDSLVASRVCTAAFSASRLALLSKLAKVTCLAELGNWRIFRWKNLGVN